MTAPTIAIITLFAIAALLLGGSWGIARSHADRCDRLGTEACVVSYSEVRR